MNYQGYNQRIYATMLSCFFFLLIGCKKEADIDPWVTTDNITIIPYKSDPENGKQYLNVIYENNGPDTYRKIKCQLITRTGTKFDTIEKTIVPPIIVKPRDKNLVPRQIGEETVSFDEVKAGKVWVVKDKP